MDPLRPMRLVDIIVGLPLIWMILWAGLAALTIALLVLMRTQWGQSQPLRKCAVLSLFAHALLACFATTVKLVSVSGGASDRPVLISLAAGDTESEVVSPAATVKAAAPWDTPQSAPEEPPAQPPERPVTSDGPAPARPDVAVSDDVPTMVEPIHKRPLDMPEPNPATASPAVRPTSSQQTAATIETPAPARREQAQVETPDAAPPRAAPKETPKLARRDTNPHATTPTPEFFQPSLPDIARSDSQESSLPAREEAIARMSSPVPPATPPTAESDAERAAEEFLARAAEADAAAQAAEAAAAADAAPSTLVKVAPGKTAPPAGVAESFQLPTINSQRFAHDRLAVARRQGGGAESESAVEAALQWFATHQEPDGHWDANRHGAGQENRALGHNREGAGAHADTGTTGLALLALLGAGHTHQSGNYAENVRRGLQYLLNHQAADGNLAGNATLFARMYCHGIAAFALAEAYAMTGDQRLQPAVHAATQYTLRAQRPVTGGWRYQPGDLGDVSQTGWQLMALKSAELGGEIIPPESRVASRRFLAGVTSGQFGGLAGYRPHQAASRSMTAEALFCRQLLNEKLSPQANAEAARYLVGELPGRGEVNLYYWYYATLGLYHQQGESWEQWNRSLQETLLASQRKEGEAAGSWDPKSTWGGYGGRVYSTAMATMCLEVYYRYLPTYVEQARRSQMVR